MMLKITKKQRQILDFLIQSEFKYPPTLEDICAGVGLKSRGSLHAHIKALSEARLVEAPEGKRRGVVLTDFARQMVDNSDSRPDYQGNLPFVGYIAAGRPIEAVETISYLAIPDQLRTQKPCYVLKIKGDSMVEEGIFDGDWVIIEQRSFARNGEIVVALINKSEATLKFIEQYPHETLLIPANASHQAIRYKPEEVEIQGVLVGQMRSYFNPHN